MEKKKKDEPGRRSFLHYLLLGLPALVVILLVKGAHDFLLPRRVRWSGMWIRAANLSDLPEGGLRYIPAEGVYIYKKGESLLVFSSKCPHLGCTVTLSGDRFECPCHGSYFSLKGELTKGPALRGLERFQKRVGPGGDLYIRK